MDFTSFYDNLKYLDEIDWPLMKAQYWNDTEEDQDRQRRHQAEFLVHRVMPWNLFTGIGVSNQQIADRVKKNMNNARNKSVLKIKNAWYYNSTFAHLIYYNKRK